MSNRRYAGRRSWPMTLLQAVLYLLLLGCFLLTALSFAVRDVVLDRTLYRDVVRRPSVPSRMIEYAREELEAECLFYGLPFDIIDEALNESVAAVYAESYVDAVYDAMFITGSVAEVPVDPALFRAPIAALLEPEGIDAETIDELAAEFAAVTQTSWSFGVGEQLMEPLHRVCGHPLVSRLSDSAYLLAGAAAALLAVSLLLGRQCIRRRAFMLAGTLTVGSILWFVPIWLLARYDLASRLVLGDTPLKILVDGVLGSIAQRLLTMAAGMLAVSLLLLVAAIAWSVWPTPENAAEEA